MRLISSLLVLTALVIIICTVALKSFRLPAPSGPYEVGTRFISSGGIHADARTAKFLAFKIWYPAAPSAKPIAFYGSLRGASLKHSYLSLLRTGSRRDAPPLLGAAPFPVLLFSHRWGGQENQNTLLAEDLASHGYIVASTSYFSDPSLTMSDAGLSHHPSDTTAQRLDLWRKVLDLWAGDEIAILDQLTRMNDDPTNSLHGLLDTEHAGAFGHSFGGAAALRLCGLDPRIRAAADLDGWTLGALKNRTADQPVLIMYEQGVINRREALLKLPNPGSTQDEIDRADNNGVDTSLKSFGGYRMYITGAQHMDFSDAPFLPLARFRSSTGPIRPSRIRTIVGTTILEFFDQSLRKRHSAFLAAPQNVFPEMSAEVWPVPDHTGASSK